VIERCEKCGKPFMDKTEVNRHKMYEHIVSVSPFEENKEEGTTIYESINPERKESGNGSHPEELQKSIITTTTAADVDTTNKGLINNNNNKSITSTQNRSRGFRSLRL
jgi:hypothetical protein